MRTSVRVAITLGLVVVALFAGYHLWQYYMLTPWTRDARVRADVVIVAPDVSGWVRELKVSDNQAVKAGDLLLSIDRERFEAALEKAQAVAQTRQQQLSLREHEAARRAALGPQAISAELRENAQINAGIARGEWREALADVKVAELNLARSQVRAPRDGQGLHQAPHGGGLLPHRSRHHPAATGTAASLHGQGGAAPPRRRDGPAPAAQLRSALC